MSDAAAVSNEDDKKAEKPPVDNATLAFMLRESADIVEKGEFDVILYHALQDFRTYYKLHLPKRKEKSKKKTDAAGSAENASSDAPTDAKSESTSNATKPASPARAAKADPPAQSASAEQPKAEIPEREVSAGATVVSEGTASTTLSTDAPASSSKLHDDAPDTAAPSAEAGSSERPIHAETGRVSSMDSILDSGRSGEEFSNESSSSLRDDADKKLASPFGKKPKNTTSKIPTNMFANKMKLPKKLPKIHVNLHSSGKKKRESELADVTGGDVAQYAESSRRRAAVDDEDGNDYQNRYNAEMLSPQRSTNLQPAVTGFGASVEIPPTSATTSVDRVRENEPADSEFEKPPSLRNNDNHNAAANNTSDTDPTPAPSTFAPPSDAFVADPRPESFDREMFDEGHSKPAFQRPKNKNSVVVANGWIEQQRRSKMRTVWKEVLASLVLGRRPGEETTLWIQRETIDAASGKKDLEALHQIPVKLLESVVYSEFTTDDRFSLKVYNSHEEFVFRCNNDASAAMNWVAILKQHEMEAKKNGNFVPPPEAAFPDFPEEEKGADMPERSASENPSKLTVRDLRAICHGAGINTVGMERADLERAATEVQKRGTFFAPPTAGHAAAASIPTGPPSGPPVSTGTASNATSRSASPIPKAAEPTAPASDGAATAKMSIKDLRAICHGAGISTVGMERGELERAATEVQKRGTYFAPPGPAPPTAPRPAPDAKPEDEAAKQEEMKRRQAAEDEARRRAAEEDHWRRHEEEARRRAAEDEHRRRAEEEHRRRVAEEEHRRRLAEQQARQAEEQRRRYAEQQAAWQHQQYEEEQRRRMAEQQAAEQRRRHEEAIRKQQQWAGQQPQHHQQQGWSQHPPQHPHQQQHYQHPQQQPHAQHHQQQWQHPQQWHHQQQYQQHQARPQGPPPPQQQHAPPPQQHPPQEQSKYAKMANQADEGGQASITKLKHDILIQWALQPPQMQMLRSVDVLLSTIQNVFPPALGVPAHEYFTKWNAVTRESVLSGAGIIDEEKVKKAVRKLRFFLHPDKLPKDMNKEQEFMVKMLWDITNDAWEEYQKSKEHLDWVK